jgi:hypothetical protein
MGVYRGLTYGVHCKSCLISFRRRKLLTELSPDELLSVTFLGASFLVILHDGDPDSPVIIVECRRRACSSLSYHLERRRRDSRNELR